MEPNKDHSVNPPNEVPPDSGNSFDSSRNCDWRAMKIKLEPTVLIETSDDDVTSSRIGDPRSAAEEVELETRPNFVEQNENVVDLPIPDTGNWDWRAMKIKLEPAICIETTDDDITPSHSGDPVEEVEHETALLHRVDHNVPSVEPPAAKVMVLKDIPPKTSSGSRSIGCQAVPEMDFQAKKMKMEPDHNDDDSEPSSSTDSESDVSAIVYTCSDCGEEFSGKLKLEIHSRIHTRPYSCDKCKKTFTQKGYLMSHLKFHKGERPFQCQKCLKRFITRSALTYHEHTHSDKHMFKCREAGCQATFASRQHLSVHRRVKHVDLPPEYQCHLCERAFYFRGDLNKHVHTHDGERFECDVCHLTFSRSNTLKIHARVHMDKPSLDCPICSKPFRTTDKNFNGDICICPKVSKDHIKTSSEVQKGNNRNVPLMTPWKSRVVVPTGVRPTTSSGSSSTVSLSAPKNPVLLDFQVKIKPNHNADVDATQPSPTKNSKNDKDTKQSTCMVCGKLEVDNGTQTNEGPYTCDACRKTFTQQLQGNLMRHLKMSLGEPSFQCQKCPERFFEQSTLTNHERIHHHHGEQFECDVCHLTFSHANALKVHSRLHTGESRFHCPTCGKSFLGINNLQLHQSSHDTADKKFPSDDCPEPPTDTETNSHQCQYCTKVQLFNNSS